MKIHIYYRIERSLEQAWPLFSWNLSGKKVSIACFPEERGLLTSVPLRNSSKAL